MDSPKKRSRRSPAGDEQKTVAYVRVSTDARALRKAAAASGLPLAEVLRRRLHAGLQDVTTLVEPAGRSVSPRQVEVGNHADE
jgi:hypothetical protein